jgi:large subunit ribosomal protein L10
MTFEEKKETVEELKYKFQEHNFFYILDSSELSVAEVNKLRSMCYEKGIHFQVAKNTLVQKAFNSFDDEHFHNLSKVLQGPTSLMFSEVSNLPAKVVKEFRKEHDKPVIKAACIENDVYVGDENLEQLSALKSKEELIGEIISLLQSPTKNVISALQSSGHKLSGIIKTLSERSENQGE